MKVLGISGSPRRGGNTELLLDKMLEGAREAGAETEKVIINELSFLPCQECGDCDKTGICTIQDDMQEMYRKTDSADAIIAASPIFFGSISAQMKMLIDRYQCCWIRKHVLHNTPKKERRGFFICVGGQNNQDYFQNAEEIVRIFFANISIIYDGAIFYSDIDNKGQITNYPTAMREAFEHGERLATQN